MRLRLIEDRVQAEEVAKRRIEIGDLLHAVCGALQAQPFIAAIAERDGGFGVARAQPERRKGDGVRCNGLGGFCSHNIPT